MLLGGSSDYWIALRLNNLSQKEVIYLHCLLKSSANPAITMTVALIFSSLCKLTKCPRITMQLQEQLGIFTDCCELIIHSSSERIIGYKFGHRRSPLVKLLEYLMTQNWVWEKKLFSQVIQFIGAKQENGRTVLLWSGELENLNPITRSSKQALLELMFNQNNSLCVTGDIQTSSVWYTWWLVLCTVLWKIQLSRIYRWGRLYIIMFWHNDAKNLFPSEISQASDFARYTLKWLGALCSNARSKDSSEVIWLIAWQVS